MRIFMLVVPDKFAAAKKMEVEVKYLLPAVFSIVSDETVTGLIHSEFLGNFLNERGHLRHHLSLNGLEVLYMLFGDDQYMDRCLGIEVMKSQKILTLMDGVVGDLPVDDLTENTHGAVLVMVLFWAIIAH
jgi:hypothetical protein